MAREYHPDIYVDPEAARRNDSRGVHPLVINPYFNGLPRAESREIPRKRSILEFEIVSEQ